MMIKKISVLLKKKTLSITKDTSKEQDKSKFSSENHHTASCITRKDLAVGGGFHPTDQAFTIY